MKAVTSAFVGTGPDPETQNNQGFAMAYRHAAAYEHAGAELVACADIVEPNAKAFADYWGIEADGVFEEYLDMVTAVEPDIVSVCTPPPTHADIVTDIARSDAVQAIHCEKPMDRTWSNVERMVEVCDEEDVKLTFNHQRRFGRGYRRAKELLDAGEIGDLQRVECAAPNIYDYGSHSVDLCNYFNDEGRAEWVISQLDYRDEDLWFGAHNENQTLTSWRYENGVYGLATTGIGADLVNCHNRLVGSKGTVEIGHGFPDNETDDRILRIKRDEDDEWEYVDCDGEGLHGLDSREFGRVFIDRAIADVVEAVENDSTSELNAENALKATEIIFGAWESSRRHGRVELPLGIEDNPLDALIEDGTLTPEPAED
ncbi:Gfo/Idh/MocA family oxidoreductase [Haladaptatus sp. T7]|uniref:Gfo/Idh/MocA family protein n=1 Tax=Haladaptatus sp. T7 TaxID=2029368 RepID=UPI0021A2573C|nr:Gfo/Idh/MocA family oxidoreductase [Haladaptatus sp. T7]GKZ14496.1 oxidoreductase [Haladaptatus sp. T7]